MQVRFKVYESIFIFYTFLKKQKLSWLPLFSLKDKTLSKWVFSPKDRAPITKGDSKMVQIHLVPQPTDTQYLARDTSYCARSTLDIIVQVK